MEKDDISALVMQLAAVLTTKHWRLATAESCTGGGIATACTDQAGSSAWFDCGFIAYSNQSKLDLLAVCPQTLNDHGAVSEPVVAAMARGVLAQSQAQVAIAVSGIAGPGGATATKPVGTVCLAWALPQQFLSTQTFLFNGDRAAVREQAVRAGLQGLLTLLR